MNTVDVIINAIWRGRDDVQRAQRDIGGIDNAAKKGSGGLKAFAAKATAAAAAMAVATIATKKLYSAIEEGAGLRLTAQRFDRLAQSIDSTGEALSENLSIATRGLLTDAEQMKLATDLIGLGLANTEEVTVRMARVATELNQDIGELQLALANQTTRRFDQLGIAVTGFDEKLQALKGTMSDEEAFTMAFLQQAEEQIQRVGGVSATEAGKLMILEANFRNTFDTMKIGLAEAVEPIIDGMANIIIAANDAEEAVAGLRDGIQALGEQQTAVNAVAAAIDKIGSAGSPFAANQTVKVRDSLLDLATQLAVSGDTFAEQQAILRDYGFEVDDIGVKLNGMGVSWVELGQRIEQAKIAEQVEGSDRALLNFNNTANETVTLVSDLATELQEMVDDFLTEDAGEFLERQGISVEVFAALTEQLGSTSAAIEYLEKVSRDAGQATDDLVISAEQLQEALELQQTQLQQRATLFDDFQEDLSTISEREEERRQQITEQYEEQRTSIVENYSRQRAQEEADWLRQRARQEEDYQRQIDDVRDDAAEAAQDARESATQRLEDLERDHLERMQDIIDNAELQLKDAASRLDAAAVARIQRNRDQALDNERDNYQEQRTNIEEALNEQLAAIQENMAERLEDMAEFHEERQRREDEDRQIRLARLEEEHREQLKELRRAASDRKTEIRQQFERERQERTQQYIDERTQLMMHLNARQQQEAAWQEAILQQEADWWQQRLDLVGGGTGNGGGDGGGGGTNPPGNKPPRRELEQMAISQMTGAGWTEDMIFSMLSEIRNWNDERLARWIEDTFNYDVPGYKTGVMSVPRTGLAMLHEGEAVLAAPEARAYRAGKLGGMSLTNNIYATPGMNEAELARKVEKVTERTMTRLFERMAT